MVEAAAASSMLEQALEYLDRGLSVFPVCTPVPGTQRCLYHQSCSSPGKVALVKWKPYQEQRASPQVVRSWWGRWPDANIAMATGRASGADVIDLDGDVATRQAIDKGFDVGPWAYTGRVGGRHIWFAHRDDAPTIFAKVGGIDFRGQGGYILLPPSLHHSGARYRWAIEPTGAPLPELPRWIDEMAAEGHTNVSSDVNGSTGTIDVEYLVEHGVPEGQRDDTLFRLAAKLRGMGIPYDIAIDVVERSAERCQPPFPLDQARAKVESAYRRYEPNPEGSKPIRLGNGHTVDPLTGEVLDTWTWPVYDIEDFMARKIPPVKWLVDGLIRDQAIVGNFGGPGTLKTYFMTQLALSIAAGERFLGIFPTVQSRVLIVEEDTLEADYQQAYLAPMLKAMGIKASELRGWLQVAPPADMLLDNPERLAILENKIAEFRPALVCMDAFYLLHSGEGMTAKDLQPILVTLKRLRRTYGCSFWLLDHNRKSSGAPISDEAAIDRWYGGRSKSAASDAVVETRARKDDDGASSFHFLKLRGSRLPSAIHVRLVDGKLIVDESQSDQASEGTKTLIINWLLTQASGRTLNDIQLGTKISHRHVQRACVDMAKDGRLVKVGKTGRADLWQLADQAEGPSLGLAEGLP